jgi:hypothetical protein
LRPFTTEAQRKAIERTDKTKRQLPVCFRFFLLDNSHNPGVCFGGFQLIFSTTRTTLGCVLGGFQLIFSTTRTTLECVLGVSS